MNIKPPGGIPTQLSQEKFSRFKNLTKEQKEVYHSIFSQERKNNLILGKSGCGKSYIIDTIRDELGEITTESKELKVVAFTGVAALNVRGSTIHRFLLELSKGTPLPKMLVIDEISMLSLTLFERLNSSMNVRYLHNKISHVLLNIGKYFDVNKACEEPRYGVWGNDTCKAATNIVRLLQLSKHKYTLKTIIKGLTTNTLSEEKFTSYIEKFMNQNTPYKKRKHTNPIDGYYDGKPYLLFGNVQVVAFGDFMQFPPIKDFFCFQSKLWFHTFKLNNIHILNKIIRQKSTRFQAFLECIRQGKIDDMTKKLLCKFMRKEIPSDIYITRLFVRNHDTDSYNKEILKKHFSTTAINLKVEVSNVDNVDEDTIIKYRKSSMFCRDLAISVGAKVMLRKNIDVKGGLVNGAMGRIIEILKNKEGDVGELIIKFDKINDPVIFTRSKRLVRKIYYNQCEYVFQSGKRRFEKCGVRDCSNIHHYSIIDHDIDIDNWTDGKIKVKPISNMRSEKRFVISQFPLILAHACTGTKSQGLTLDKCIVDISRFSFIPDSWLYVCLSRARSSKGLYICGKGIDVSMIKPNSEAVEYMKELLERKEKSNLK